MDFKDFLMELYLLYGEREFTMLQGERHKSDEHYKCLMQCRQGNKYLKYRCTPGPGFKYTLTPKALEYLKNG